MSFNIVTIMSMKNIYVVSCNKFLNSILIKYIPNKCVSNVYINILNILKISWYLKNAI